MNNIVHYSQCPVCGSTDIKNVLTAKDNTVSGKTFQIMECGSCTLRFTQDVPDAETISSYYKAEDYISHTDTSKGLINRIYKIVRKRTLVRKRKLIERFTGLRTGKALDVGSGTGSFVNELKQNGWNITGLEPDNDARKVAKQLYTIDLLDSAELYKLSPGNFDAISLWHVLEHVHDLAAYVQQLRILLKDNGKLFVAIPNYTSTDSRIYKEYWAAYDVPRHLYHFSPASMKELMEKNSLRIIQYKPMWYDSFYICLLSSKYKNAVLPDLPSGAQGKANWIAAFWNGLRSNLNAVTDVKRCSSVIYIIEKIS
ncbi:MAG: class I SAM-dependent methyltransferase [Chitinophagales bacterium]